MMPEKNQVIDANTLKKEKRHINKLMSGMPSAVV